MFNNTTQHYIGIMSGTSMDGADAVLIRMQQNQWQAAEAHHFIPYPTKLKQQLLELQNINTNELHRSQLLAIELSHLYAQTITELLQHTNHHPKDICAIGCHGQTIRHAPEHHYSIQLVNLPLLAEKTGIFTIGDFRNRDLAAGGQGAPLVPAFHQALFAHHSKTRIILNIGGIANISILRPKQPPIGFDTGAGNMLLDAWAQHIWQQPYDNNGHLSAKGKIIPELLSKLTQHPYFQKPHPKSTGRELFSLNWLKQHLNGTENPHNVMRTLVQFTADTIIQAIKNHAPNTHQVYVCGGGIKHPLLINILKQHLSTQHITLHSTEELNLNPQWVEAAAFAWLAACWINQIPSNSPTSTGANKPLILGAGHFA